MPMDGSEVERLPRILIVHNAYQQRGGEDIVVQAEIDLLRSLGATVKTMVYDSQDTERLRALEKHPGQLIFNHGVYDEVRSLIRRHQIQIVHCHNLFPLLSTSVYVAAFKEEVPVVQTIHNYRMACLNGLHQREGRICERCSPGHHTPGMAHGCYRGSRLQSLAFGMAQTINYWRGAWEQPTLYVVPSPFVREKLIGWNVPPEKITVKPHFVPNDPGCRSAPGLYALFVGRLSEEKGLDLLIDIWDAQRLPLVIVGDGPLRARLEQRVRQAGLTNVYFTGRQERTGVNIFMQNAQVLLMPSTWYESFGMVLIEAYAHGVPVIATRIGAIENIVRDGETGALFRLNDPADLSAKLAALEQNPTLVTALSMAARREYEQRYSAAVIGEQLRGIYAHALSAKRVPGRK